MRGCMVGAKAPTLNVIVHRQEYALELTDLKIRPL